MRSRKKPLYEALLKVKEELMLLGFISLLLNVLQGPMGRWCVNPDIMRHLLPCKPPPRASRKTEHLGDAVFAGARRLLAGGGGDSEGYCMEKVPVATI
jgi:mlo protein